MIYLESHSLSSEHKNPKSSLSFLKVVSSYFGDERSFAQFKMKDGKKLSKLGFYPESNALVIITIDGHYYHINFDPVSGGEGIIRAQERITSSLQT